VSLSVARLEVFFDRPASSVTTSITLTLLFRPLGAIIFGLLSDRYGRKWPLIANLLICAVLSLGTGFVQTFSQFLAVRSLFGIAMGGEPSLSYVFHRSIRRSDTLHSGIWGLAVSYGIWPLGTFETECCGCAGDNLFGNSSSWRSWSFQWYRE
jgi:MFS family permease